MPKKFYEESIEERRRLIFKKTGGFEYSNVLHEFEAEKMIENCIGVYGLPLGVLPAVLINGNQVMVPMVTEEPSVVAGANSASKTVNMYGGVSVIPPQMNIISGQILVSVSDLDRSINKIRESQTFLIKEANKICRNMVERGGGCVAVRVEPTAENLICVYFDIDTKDAMGFNCANSLVEDISPIVATVTNGTCRLKIATNNFNQRVFRATIRIPVNGLKYKNIEGKEIAEGFCLASKWAEKDPDRAITHNKGIMNGIDAVGIASGQDWRAIEASAHIYACRSGKYSPLSKYWVSDEHLHGQLDIPLAIGIVGGSTQINPGSKDSIKLMGCTTSMELGCVMAAVGLLQNFAAVRALYSEGIQSGHMRLHARKFMK